MRQTLQIYMFSSEICYFPQPLKLQYVEIVRRHCFNCCITSVSDERCEYHNFFPTKREIFFDEAVDAQLLGKKTLLFLLFVWFEAIRPSQKKFSHVGTEPQLSGYYQYILGDKCILLKDTTR